MQHIIIQINSQSHFFHKPNSNSIFSQKFPNIIHSKLFIHFHPNRLYSMINYSHRGSSLRLGPFKMPKKFNLGNQCEHPDIPGWKTGAESVPLPYWANIGVGIERGGSSGEPVISSGGGPRKSCFEAVSNLFCFMIQDSAAPRQISHKFFLHIWAYLDRKPSTNIMFGPCPKVYLLPVGQTRGFQERIVRFAKKICLRFFSIAKCNFVGFGVPVYCDVLNRS